MLKVRKRPGKEKEDVLKADSEGNDDDEDDEDGEGGVWSKLFGAGKKKVPPAAAVGGGAVVPAAAEAEGDVINVFTVASGHMYERLQKIMFLSVVKNSKRCVNKGSTKGQQRVNKG